jgi:hypothetical protein
MPQRPRPAPEAAPQTTAPPAGAEPSEQSMRPLPPRRPPQVRAPRPRGAIPPQLPALDVRGRPPPPRCNPLERKIGRPRRGVPGPTSHSGPCRWVGEGAGPLHSQIGSAPGHDAPQMNGRRLCVRAWPRVGRNLHRSLRNGSCRERILLFSVDCAIASDREPVN